MTIDKIKVLAVAGADMPAILGGLSEYLEQLGADVVAAGEAIREAGADSLDGAGAMIVQIATARRMLEAALAESGEALDVAIYTAGVSGAA